MIRSLSTSTLLAILALAPLAFTGCSQGAYTPKSDPASVEAQGLPVAYEDKDLRRVLAVDNPIVAGRTTAGFINVQAGLRNMTNDETLNIQVQTLFRNPSGLVLYSDMGSEPAWQTLTLTPGQTAYYKQSALTAEATNFTIRVRYLQRPN